MIKHFCEVMFNKSTRHVIRLEIEKHWSRHDIVMHCIRRSYLTIDEAKSILALKKRWNNCMLKGYIPLDKTPYIYKEFKDKYVMRGVV